MDLLGRTYRTPITYRLVFLRSWEYALYLSNSRHREQYVERLPSWSYTHVRRHENRSTVRNVDTKRWLNSMTRVMNCSLAQNQLPTTYHSIKILYFKDYFPPWKSLSTLNQCRNKESDRTRSVFRLSGHRTGWHESGEPDRYTTVKESGWDNWK